jgi:hypothetical protein
MRLDELAENEEIHSSSVRWGEVGEDVKLRWMGEPLIEFICRGIPS